MSDPHVNDVSELLRREVEELKKQNELSAAIINNHQIDIAKIQIEHNEIGKAVHSLKEILLGRKEPTVPISAMEIVEWIRCACTKLVEQHNFAVVTANGMQGAEQWQMIINGLQGQLHNEQVKNDQLEKEKKMMGEILNGVDGKLKDSEEKEKSLKKTVESLRTTNQKKIEAAETCEMTLRNDLKTASEKIEFLEKTAGAHQNELKAALDKIENLEHTVENYEKHWKTELEKIEDLAKSALTYKKELKEALQKIENLEKIAETTEIVHPNDLKAALKKSDDFEKIAESYQKNFRNSLERIENLKKTAETTQIDYEKKLEVASKTIENLQKTAETSQIDYEKKLEVASKTIENLQKSAETSQIDYEKKLEVASKTIENLQNSALSARIYHENNRKNSLEKIEELKKTVETYKKDCVAAWKRNGTLKKSAEIYEKDLKEALEKIDKLKNLDDSRSEKKSVECQTDEENNNNEELLQTEIEKMQESFLSNGKCIEDMRKMLIGEEPKERDEGCTVDTEPGLLYRIRTLEELCLSKDSIIAALNDRSLISEFELCQLRDIIGLTNQIEGNVSIEGKGKEINENLVSSSSGIGEKKKADFITPCRPLRFQTMGNLKVLGPVDVTEEPKK